MTRTLMGPVITEMTVPALVDSVDLGAVAEERPRPDGFLYRFDLCGATASVREQALTPGLRRIAELLLD